MLLVMEHLLRVQDDVERGWATLGVPATAYNVAGCRQVLVLLRERLNGHHLFILQIVAVRVKRLDVPCHL